MSEEKKDPLTALQDLADRCARVYDGPDVAFDGMPDLALEVTRKFNARRAEAEARGHKLYSSSLVGDGHRRPGPEHARIRAEYNALRDEILPLYAEMLRRLALSAARLGADLQLLALMATSAPPAGRWEPGSVSGENVLKEMLSKRGFIEVDGRGKPSMK